MIYSSSFSFCAYFRAAVILPLYVDDSDRQTLDSFNISLSCIDPKEIASIEYDFVIGAGGEKTDTWRNSTDT